MSGCCLQVAQTHQQLEAFLSRVANALEEPSSPIQLSSTPAINTASPTPYLQFTHDSIVVDICPATSDNQLASAANAALNDAFLSVNDNKLSVLYALVSPNGGYYQRIIH
jgi:hypothetical protein